MSSRVVDPCAVMLVVLAMTMELVTLITLYSSLARVKRRALALEVLPTVITPERLTVMSLVGVPEASADSSRIPPSAVTLIS